MRVAARFLRPQSRPRNRLRGAFRRFRRPRMTALGRDDGTRSWLTISALERAFAAVYTLVFTLTIPLWLVGCGNDKGPVGGDTKAPGPVRDLAVSEVTRSSVTLVWTAPGEDEDVGTASEYDIRYSTTGITLASWASATHAADPPSPSPPGTPQAFQIGDLQAATTYDFALKTIDDAANISALSNTVEATTSSFSNQEWDGVFGAASTPDSYVTSLAEFGGAPIIGGFFINVEASAVNHIARWSGENWVSMGGGVTGGGLSNPSVFAMIPFSGSLVAAGTFSTAGGSAAYNVASWSGTAWQTLGNGLPGPVWALTLWNGNLIAGGGGSISSAAFVSEWNDPDWTRIGDDLGGAQTTSVNALAVYDGDLIAGGKFPEAQATEVNHVARWDGAAWHPLGSGVTDVGQVYALHVHEGLLIVGGRFRTAGGSTASNIAAWDGTTWTTLGEGFDGEVHALATYNGQLVAGGAFSHSGTDPLPGIARWNPDQESWQPMGDGITLNSGVSGTVYALATIGSSLYVGGLFDEAGRKPSINVARWTE